MLGVNCLHTLKIQQLELMLTIVLYPDKKIINFFKISVNKLYVEF